MGKPKRRKPPPWSTHHLSSSGPQVHTAAWALPRSSQIASKAPPAVLQWRPSLRPALQHVPTLHLFSLAFPNGAALADSLPSLKVPGALPRHKAAILSTLSPQQRDPPHNSADITRQVPPTGSGCEILLGVQPVSVNHEVPICQVA